MKVRQFQGRRDIAGIARIFATAFGGVAVGEEYAKYLRGLKPREYKNHRCLEVDGRIVSFLEVVPRSMYIGRSLLAIAGIGGVVTDPNHRKKGYNRALLDDTIEFMTEERYDLSILYGIPGYYHKFGYEVVMADYYVTLSPPDHPGGWSSFAASAVRKDDLPALCRLYNAQARFRDGNCRRKTMQKPKRGLKLCDRKGRPVAYASWRDEEGTMSVRDAAARNTAAGEELLKVLLITARRNALDHLKITLPFGYPLTDAIARRTSMFHRKNTRNKGCMGRITNLPTLAGKMEKEWAYLLGRSEFAGKAANLKLLVDARTLSISYSGGKVTTRVTSGKADGSVTQERFAQMLLGYRNLSELADEKDVGFGRGQLRLLEVLFPERCSTLLMPDRF